MTDGADVERWLNSPEAAAAGMESADIAPEVPDTPVSAESSVQRSNSPQDLNDIEFVNIQDYMSLDIMRYDFSQVIFLDVKEFYSPGTNLICRYKVTQELFPHPKDKICLFKIGWLNPKEYLTYMWAPLPRDYIPGMLFDQNITYSGAFVPETTQEDFYQFCYINHQDQIRGASTPFQFKVCISRSVSEVTDSQPCSRQISVTEPRESSPSSHLVEKLKGENEMVLRDNAGKEQALFDAQLQIEQLKERLSNYDMLEEEHGDLRSRYSDLTNGMEVLQAKLGKERDTAFTALEKDFTNTKKALEEKDAQFRSIVQRASEIQSERVDLMKQREELFSEKEELIEKVNKLSQTVEEKDAEIGRLNEQQLHVQQELDLRKQQLGENDSQLTDYSSRVEEIMAENESQLAELEKTRSILMQTETELKAMHDALSVQTEEMEKIKKSHDTLAAQQQCASNMAGPIYALKTALDHTQAKLDLANKNVEKLLNDKTQLSDELAVAQAESSKEGLAVSELVMRLDMCKQSYKLKVLEAKRLRKDLKEALKSDKTKYNTLIAETDSYCARVWNDISTNDPSIDAMGECATAAAAAANKPRTQRLSESSVQTVDSMEAESAQCPSGLDWKAAHDKLQHELASRTQWKKYDFCMHVASDGVERLAIVVDVDRVNLLANIRLLPVNAKSQPAKIQCPLDKIRPYRGEQNVISKNPIVAPRERGRIRAQSSAALKPCHWSKYEYVDPALTLALFTRVFQLSTTDSQTLSSSTTSSSSSTTSAGSASSTASASIGGVGWGNLGKQLKEPIKTFMTSAGVVGAPRRNTAAPLEEPVLVSSEDCCLNTMPVAGGDDEGKCVLCDTRFPRDVKPEVFNAHMEEHYGPSCPMCNFRLPKSADVEQKMLRHVEQHFV